MKVGIVGYGHLGQHLVEFILKEGQEHDLEICFVWNRSPSKLSNTLPQSQVLLDLKNAATHCPDLIVEVAHPQITKDYGEFFLSIANYMIGSPTALADLDLESRLYAAATKYSRALYVPSGAFWGAQDIKKMADLGVLSELKVTMKKHPSAFRLSGQLHERNQRLMNSSDEGSALVLYEGPVRELCALAPNNVNTMAAAAVAGHNLGFDKVVGRLISDVRLKNWHIVEVDACGLPNKAGDCFSVTTLRKNPATPGAVTGSATFKSFCNSLLLARNTGSGVHMC